MFNSHEINILNACIGTYIELADNQINALTVGNSKCIDLIDVYELHKKSCYDLLLKINTMRIDEMPIPSLNFSDANNITDEDLAKVKTVLKKLLTQKVN